MTPSHLHPGVVADLDLPPDVRINHLGRQYWVNYPVAERALARLQSMFDAPRKERMRNLLIYGPTNNGKTSILECFQRRHPSDIGKTRDASCFPVVRVQMPSPANLSAFYDAILSKFVTPIRDRDAPHVKARLTISLLRVCDTRLLILDEIHHVLVGDSKRAHTMLTTIKFLGNELQMPIVAAGTQESVAALNQDDQIANRFERFEIPTWAYGDVFLSFLHSVERLIPLRKPSGLADEHLAKRIHQMAGGLIGEVTKLLQAAAEYAIRSERERITLDTLDEIDWAPWQMGLRAKR